MILTDSMGGSRTKTQRPSIQSREDPPGRKPPAPRPIRFSTGSFWPNFDRNPLPTSGKVEENGKKLFQAVSAAKKEGEQLGFPPHIGRIHPTQTIPLLNLIITFQQTGGINQISKNLI